MGHPSGPWWSTPARRTNGHNSGLLGTCRPRRARPSPRRALRSCGLRTNGPTPGPLAHRARAILTVDKEPQGTEQNDGCLKAPVIVHSLFLQKPERLAALGRVLFLALLIWRWRERAMRRHVDSTSTPLPGWDKQATERPTSCRMVTPCAGVIVVKLGTQRQRARPLSGVQHPSLPALDVPATCGTLPAGEQRTAMAARRLSRRHKRLLQWLATDHQRTRGLSTSSQQDVVRALPGDKGNISHSLHPREARGLFIIGRSPDGKAESVWLTSEGQQWASQLAGSCDEGKNNMEAIDYNPRSRGLSEHGAFPCEECCIPAHMQGGSYQWEEDFGKKCQRWVVTRDSAWRREHDGCNIAVFQRTLLSILHSQSRKNHLCRRKNRLVQPLPKPGCRHPDSGAKPDVTL